MERIRQEAEWARQADSRMQKAYDTYSCGTHRMRGLGR